MKIKKILQKVDHTMLMPTATWVDIKKICDEGILYSVASVCIPATFVKKAAEYVQKKVKICTVVGFPNGYNTTASKVFETEDAIKNGADEIDMVINLGYVKEGNFDEQLDELRRIKGICGSRILKVIVETCLLTEAEKIKMCEVVTKSGADYIKTSTGFSKNGATFADIELFTKHVGAGVKIKAAGGISSVEDAEKFITLGASRLGTSRIVRIAESQGA